MYKNIVVTTANSTYFYSLLTLISGIHLFGENCVNQIYVYNLGLDDSEVHSLNRLENVTVVEYQKKLNEKHLKFLDPKSYIYKSYCLENSAEYAENVFWLDAGTTPINEMCGIFDIIQSDEIFLVVDTHKIGDYTHSDCIKIMSATNEELNEKMLSAGICGFKTNGKYRQMIKELFDYSMIPGCCDGDQENHRHDQSILSILATRYKCPKQDIDIYGYWTDSNRNLQTAINNNAVIFVHRRGHHDVSGLKYKNI